MRVSFKVRYWFCEVWVLDQYYNGTAGLCGLNNDRKIIQKCNQISNPDSYFAQCHDFVDPESFTENCMTDLCELNNDQSICNIYDLYLTACADAMNTTLCEWSDCARLCLRHSDM